MPQQLYIDTIFADLARYKAIDSDTGIADDRAGRSIQHVSVAASRQVGTPGCSEFRCVIEFGPEHKYRQSGPGGIPFFPR